MINVDKHESESTASLLRRFSRKVKESSVLIVARKNRFYSRPKSEHTKKTEALRRIQRQKKVERLRKLGKIE